MLAALFHAVAVVDEGLCDVLFAFAHPTALDFCHVDDEEVALGLACQLIHRLGLARSRGAVKQAGEAFAHADALKAFLHLPELADGDERREFGNLLALALVVEELLLAERGVGLQFLDIGLCRLHAFHPDEKLILGHGGDVVEVVVAHALAAQFLKKILGEEERTLVGQRLAQMSDMIFREVAAPVVLADAVIFLVDQPVGENHEQDAFAFHGVVIAKVFSEGFAEGEVHVVVDEFVDVVAEVVVAIFGTVDDERQAFEEGIDAECLAFGEHGVVVLDGTDDDLGDTVGVLVVVFDGANELAGNEHLVLAEERQYADMAAVGEVGELAYIDGRVVAQLHEESEKQGLSWGEVHALRKVVQRIFRLGIDAVAELALDGDVDHALDVGHEGVFDIAADLFLVDD